MNDLRTVKKGIRIKVFDINKQFIDLGTIIDVVDLVDDTGEVLSKNFPIIKLDSGEELTGLECWWIVE